MDSKEEFLCELFSTLARLGIISAHLMHIAGIHTVTIVMILWTLEECVSVYHDRKKLVRR